MNVVIINQYAITPDRAGITRHFMLARQLVNRGHDVTIIASSFDHLTQTETRPGIRARDPLAETHDGVRFVWIRTPPYTGNSGGRVRNMLTFAAAIAARRWARSCPVPDVIIGSSPHLFGAAAAACVARRRDVPFVLEVRDLWPLSLVELGKMSPRNPVVTVLGSIERYLYRSAQEVVTLLEGAVAHIEEKGGPMGRVHWLPNGVDVGGIPRGPSNENPTFTVMYAGAHGLANALDAVIDAAAIVAKHDDRGRILFRLVGDGPHKEGLRSKVAALALHNVRFEQPVDKASIFHTLLQADAFIVNMQATALYHHGISLNKVYDYMAAQRPIIFGADAPRNPVELASAGIVVEPNNPTALAEAVMHIARLPVSERNAMGARGRDFVEMHHSITQLGARLECILTMAVENRA